MALLVHLTPANNAPRIRRAGIAAVSWSAGTERGVYCTPVLPSHTLTYQWTRELLRNQSRSFAAVHFRIPDDEAVLVGRYNDREPRRTTAAEAVGLFLGLDDPRGYQIFLPRAVPASAVHRVRTLNRPVGWRYFPDAHGRRPCTCPVCLRRGEYKAADLRRRLPLDPPRPPRAAVLAALRHATTPQAIVDLLWELDSRRKGDAFRLAFLVEHPDADVREALADVLGGFRGRDAADLLRRLRLNPVAAVREAATP